MPHQSKIATSILTTLVIALGFAATGALLHADWKAHQIQHGKVEAAIADIEKPLIKSPRGFRGSYGY